MNSNLFIAFQHLDVIICWGLKFPCCLQLFLNMKVSVEVPKEHFLPIPNWNNLLWNQAIQLETLPLLQLTKSP